MDFHRAETLRQRVVDDGNVDRHIRHARIERDQIVRHRRVILAVNRRAVGGRVENHGRCAAAAAEAQHVDGGDAVDHILRHLISRRRQVHFAVIIQNMQHRDGLAAVLRRQNRIHLQVDFQVGRDDQVMDDGNGHRLLHFAQREDDNVGGADIIGARQRRAVAGHERHVDDAGAVGVRAHRAAGADDRDERVRRAFRHRKIGHGKFKRAHAADRAAVNPRNALMRMAKVMGEAAADDDFFIRHIRRITGNRILLDDDGRHKTVRAGTEIDGRIHRAVGIQARDAAADHAAAMRELAAQHDAVVRLQSNRRHHVVRAHARREAVVNRTVAVQADDVIDVGAVDAGERAANQNFSVELNLDGLHRAVRAGAGERGIHRAIHIQPRHMICRHAVDRGEIAADDDLAVGLHRERKHRAVRAQPARIERAVRGAVVIQTSDVMERHAVERRKAAAHENFPVRTGKCFRERIDRIVRAGTGVKQTVQRAVLVQPRNMVIDHAVAVGEKSAEHHAAVRLHHHRAHRRVRAHRRGGQREACIQRAVGVQARDALARHAVGLREIAADHELVVIGLQRQRKHRAVEARRGAVSRVIRAGRLVHVVGVNDVQGRQRRHARRRTR